MPRDGQNGLCDWLCVPARNCLFPLLASPGISLVLFYFHFKVKGEGNGIIMCCLSPQPQLALDSPTCRRNATKGKFNIHISHHCISYPVQFADDTKFMRDDQGWGCHSEQAQQAGGEGQQEMCEIQGQMQSPTPRREEGLAEAVNGQAGEEPCWKGRGVGVCVLMEGHHEPAVSPGSKTSQHSGLLGEQQSQDRVESYYHPPIPQKGMYSKPWVFPKKMP